jgi:WD40 repeat protein
MNLPKLAVVLLLVFILAGCAPAMTPPASTIQQSDTATSTNIAPPPTMREAPVLETVFVCRGKDGYIPVSPESEIRGTIIYQNFGYEGIYTIDMTSLERGKLLDDKTQKSVALGISHDGHWLAYEFSHSAESDKLEQLHIILLSADGDRIERVFDVSKFEDNLQVGHQLLGVSPALSYWINSQLIYLTLYSQNPDSPSGYISELPVVLEPFSAEWKNQLLDLPDRTSSAGVGISPDLTRALYTQRVLYSRGGLSLWDYDQEIELWHDEALHATFRDLISWNADSTKVVYINLFYPEDTTPVWLVSREGGARPILRSDYPLPGFQPRNASWSPDGRYLALAGLDGDDLNILIYDVVSEKYIIQCPIAELNQTTPILVWSPGGSHVAISQYDMSIRILDIPLGAVFDLGKYGHIVGWSDKFSVTWP